MASGSAGSIYVDLLLRDSGFERGLSNARRSTSSAFSGIASESNKARNALEGVLNPVRNISSALGTLGISVAGAFSIQSIVKYSDAWKQLQGRLSIVETDMSAVGRAQESLFEIAQRNRSPLETVTNFYQRLNQFVPEAVRNQYDMLGVTESVTAAIAITGENSISAQAALVQFSQAIGTNFEASGQELRSIQEQAPRLAKALSTSLGGGTKSLQQLKEEGVLTRDSVLRALSGVGEEGKRMAEELAKIPLTVGQAFTRLDNAFLKYIGQSKLIESGTGTIAASIDGLASNLQNVANVFTGVAVVLSAKFFGPIVKEYSELLFSQNAYTRAVAAGRVVTIDSLEAVKLKASAELDASRKGVAAVEARIAALKKEQQQIIALRAQYANTSPASIAGSVNNPSSTAAVISAQNGLYAQQSKLTKDLIANKSTLAAEEAVLASTSAATSLALTRYNAAALAASLSTRALAAASRLASGALALLGGPVGATIIALYAGVKIIGNFSDELNAAGDAFNRLNEISQKSSRFQHEYAQATKETRLEIREQTNDMILAAAAQLKILNILNEQNQKSLGWESFKGWIGVSDSVAETEKNAIRATEELGRLYELLNGFNDVDSGKKPFVEKPAGSEKDAKKAAEELSKLYEKNQRYLQGLSKEQFSYNEQIGEFNKLLEEGKISQEEYYTAIGLYQDELREKTEETFVDMEAISKRAAENMQDAFADFLFDPFKDGLDGMLLGFVDTLRKMVAQQASASLFENIGKSAIGTGLSALLGGSGGFNNSGQSGLPWQSFGNVNPQGGVYSGNFGGFFADGGHLGAGKWGVVGENGPELAFGGRTGKTIVPNGASGGNSYYIDARGADQGAVTRIEAALVTLAGPGVIEKRVINAQKRGSL